VARAPPAAGRSRKKSASCFRFPPHPPGATSIRPSSGGYDQRPVRTRWKGLSPQRRDRAARRSASTRALEVPERTMPACEREVDHTPLSAAPARTAAGRPGSSKGSPAADWYRTRYPGPVRAAVAGRFRAGRGR